MVVSRIPISLTNVRPEIPSKCSLTWWIYAIKNYNSYIPCLLVYTRTLAKPQSNWQHPHLILISSSSHPSSSLPDLLAGRVMNGEHCPHHNQRCPLLNVVRPRSNRNPLCGRRWETSSRVFTKEVDRAAQSKLIMLTDPLNRQAII